MKLQDIISRLRERDLLTSESTVDELDVTGVSVDSRKTSPGDLFCAVQGTDLDGHDYLAAAQERGAVAALVTREVPDAGLPVVRVNDGRAAAALAAATFFDWPARKLKVIGVTGTNGKSTTVAITRHLIDAEGRVGIVGTLGAYDGRNRPLPDLTGLTTPGPVELQRSLSSLATSAHSGVVMEVSSHALDQHRVGEIDFHVGVFTNLTREHLDYHGDMHNYRESKLRLARMLRPGGAAVVNRDDPAWQGLETPPEVRRIEYGLGSGAEVRAREPEFGPSGTNFKLAMPDREVSATLPLPGEFNLSNALAAAATAWFLEVDLDQIVSRLKSAPTVPGRMEVLYRGDFVVIRDYAHTPDAFRRVLPTLRAITGNRVGILFGCGGDRDRGKRSAMGRIAAQHADFIILSSDNPRSEDPSDIIDDIAEGIEGKAFLRIPDREEGIRRALEMMEPGDTLLLAGKGHETYQQIGDQRLPFDEKSIVQNLTRA